MSASAAAGGPPLWIDKASARVSAVVRLLCVVLLALMVLFTAYTVLMRYVFANPPFWGDTVSMFCNIWVTMLGYSLAVRDREDIAMRGIYRLLPARAGFLLETLWNVMAFAFGLFLVWYGWLAARDVPGMFWELGGLKKTYPMLVMPFAGALAALAALTLIVEDVLILAGKREGRRIRATGQDVL